MKADPKNDKHAAPLLRFALLVLSVLMLTVALALLFLPKEEGDKTGQTANGDEKTAAVIYLDPGHGDFDFGAVASLPDGSRLLEKDLVLSLALDAQDALRARGYTVHLSREGDERHTYTTSADEVYARRADAEEKGVRVLLSIHANAYAGEGRAYGARVYYDPQAKGAARAATRFAAAVTEAGAPRALRECRTVPDGSYAILDTACDTALLFECGFLSDREECALLADAEYRSRLVLGIVSGIEAIAWEK